MSYNRGAEHRNLMGRIDRDKAESIRCIGKIPVIQNIERRNSCRDSLARFFEVYIPGDKWAFSDDHLRVIKRIENTIFHGGRFVEAVYRGFGKSTLTRTAALWSILYGHKKYCTVIAANERAATTAIDVIKIFIKSKLFIEDFPEISFPIEKLEGITQRAYSQLYIDKNDEVVQTNLGWSSDKLVFPNTDGAFDTDGNFIKNISRSSIILCAGITSKTIRGLNAATREGDILRPDLAIIDDPQDEESADSPMQVTKRFNIIHKSILQGAGHKDGISLIMPCTIIQQNDLVSQLLDRKKNPAWQGEKIPLVKTFPTNKDLWLENYKDILFDYDISDPDGFIKARKKATKFYKNNFNEMNEGCEISWQECYGRDRDEISAIQHAYNFLLENGEEVFASEYQQEPLAPPEEEGQLTEEVVYQRIDVNRIRSSVPINSQKLTAFIDVQKNCLFYMVVAWESCFTGCIIDYGCYPKQNKTNFALRDIAITIFDKHKNAGQEGVWHAALEALSEILLTKNYNRDDASPMRINRLLIDANDGNAAETIFNYCKRSNFSQLILPARGRAITASSLPFLDYTRKPGDIVSPYNWRIPSIRGKHIGSRYIYSDINWWKSFTRSRFLTMPGDRGNISIFGKELNGNKASHQMLGQHMTSEYSIRTSGRGRNVDEWSLKPNRENHYFDCVVGCAIAASEQGIILGQTRDEKDYMAMRRKSRKEKLAAIGKVVG